MLKELETLKNKTSYEISALEDDVRLLATENESLVEEASRSSKMYEDKIRLLATENERLLTIRSDFESENNRISNELAEERARNETKTAKIKNLAQEFEKLRVDLANTRDQASFYSEESSKLEEALVALDKETA